MGTLTTRDEPGPGDRSGILDVRLSGPPELVDAAVAALTLVLEVADVSRPYPNRRGAPGGVRRYLRALGLGPEAARFLGRGAPGR